MTKRSVVAIVLAAIATVAGLPEAKAVVVFSDDFNRDTLGDEWKQIDGSPPDAFINSGRLEHDSLSCVYYGQTFDGTQPTSYRLKLNRKHDPAQKQLTLNFGLTSTDRVEWFYNQNLSGDDVQLVCSSTDAGLFFNYKKSNGHPIVRFVRTPAPIIEVQFEAIPGGLSTTFTEYDPTGTTVRQSFTASTTADTIEDGFIGFRRSKGNLEIDDFSVTAGPITPPECDPGDADKDGDVDDDDLSLLLANWGIDTDCAHGEFSGVPPVNDDDLSLLLANWTGPLGGAVPEPTTMAMLIFGALALLRRRS